jgi:hypothetical protein
VVKRRTRLAAICQCRCMIECPPMARADRPYTNFPYARNGRRRPLVAHCRDGGLSSWRPVTGIVLPPLWHQGHKTQPMPRTRRGGQLPQDRGKRTPGSGGRTDGLRKRPAGRVVGASEMATGGVVRSAAIPAPASPPPIGPKNARASQASGSASVDRDGGALTCRHAGCGLFVVTAQHSAR